MSDTFVCNSNHVPSCLQRRSRPAGPSAEQRRQNAIAADYQEAADDAEDRGIAAYERGDYAAAVRLFEEAADYAPDDDSIAANLRQARAQVRQAEAERQLSSAREHGDRAGRALTGERSALEATRPFDSSGNAGATIAGSVSARRVMRDSGGHVVVPPELVTPAIADLLRRRDAHRSRAAAIDAELPTLNHNMHQRRIERLRQERTDADEQVEFLDFSLEDAVIGGLSRDEQQGGSQH